MVSLLEAIIDTEEHLFCTAMMERLDIQRRNEQFCDVILEVGSGDDEARLKAHRVVLCAASPFFYNALNSDMKEKKEGVIRLKEISKAVMEEVLEYLYTGHVEITKENAFELFAQANFFVISSLKSLTTKFILQTLDFSNCVVAYKFSMKYDSDELCSGAREFIRANFLTVAGTEDFMNLTKSEIEDWISDDCIIVKEEEEVFQVIVNWMEKNQNSKDADFLQLLSHVRCIYVSRSYIFNIILQHPLVKASAACTEFILGSMREVSNGTEECFILQSPRDCLKTHKEAIVLCGANRTLCFLPFEDKLYDLCSMPSTRDAYNYTMSSLHGKLYVVGGSKSSRSSTVECYDPSRNLWTLSKAPEILKQSTGTATLHGFLYVAGGKGNNKELLNTVQKYNPDRNHWQEVSPLSSPRSNVCAVADGTYLYAIGGISATGEYLDIVERFDPRKNSWQKLPSTHAKRANASGTVMTQKVFVFGGLRKQSAAGDPCEMFDPDTNIWSGIACKTAPRNFASAVSLDGEIYVFGTFQNEPGTRHLSVHLFDSDEKKFECCMRIHIHVPSVYEEECYHISTLRISRDVLTKWREISISKSYM